MYHFREPKKQNNKIRADEVMWRSQRKVERADYIMVVPLPNLWRSTHSLDTGGKPGWTQFSVESHHAHRHFCLPQKSTENSGHDTDIRVYRPPFILKWSMVCFPEDQTFKLSTDIKQKTSFQCHYQHAGSCKVQRINCLCCLVAFRCFELNEEQLLKPTFVNLHMTSLQTFNHKSVVIAVIAGTFQELFVQTNTNWPVTQNLYKS